MNRPQIISTTTPDRVSRRGHSRNFPQLEHLWPSVIRFLAQPFFCLCRPRRLNASKVNLRQLNSFSNVGALGLKGWSPWLVADVCPRCLQLAGTIHEILSLQPPTHWEVTQGSQSVPPVEINGASSAYWQQKEIYTANKPVEKEWKYLFNRSTSIKVTQRSNYSPSPRTILPPEKKQTYILAEYWWKDQVMSRCTILGVLISEVAHKFLLHLSVHLEEVNSNTNSNKEIKSLMYVFPISVLSRTFHFYGQLETHLT